MGKKGPEERIAWSRENRRSKRAEDVWGGKSNRETYKDLKTNCGGHGLTKNLGEPWRATRFISFFKKRLLNGPKIWGKSWKKFPPSSAFFRNCKTFRSGGGGGQGRTQGGKEGVGVWAIGTSTEKQSQEGKMTIS